MSQPICTIVAGPNGAGKTTFAMTYLPTAGHCRNFINADLIAAGLSPFDPDRASVMAGRLFLQEIHDHVKRRESFAFETTLSGRTHLKLISNLLENSWIVELIYLWIPNVELARTRVAERVSHGGHNIPDDVIARRYPKSVWNLLHNYAPLCSSTICMENAGPNPKLIFTESQAGRIVEDDGLYQVLLQGVAHD